jgi:hypothetical protein
MSSALQGTLDNLNSSICAKGDEKLKRENAVNLTAR